MTVISTSHNDQRLLVNVDASRAPAPFSAGRYNMLVIGAGTAGLVIAAGAAGLGAKVALIERHLMGGDCLNYGCVPSKALLSAARAIHAANDATRMGIASAVQPTVDFAAVMERMRRIRAELSSNDSVARFKGLGVDVFGGQARFTGRDTVEVGGQTLRFTRAVIATGARAAALQIPGLAEAGYLTNETVFSLAKLPLSLAIIGAGPVGCELAQAFRRFGAAITLFEATPRILPREDIDAADRIATALRRDGIDLVTAAKINAVERRGDQKVVRFTIDGAADERVVDEILAGVGRAPNVEALGLEAAGVSFDQNGVKVDDYLRTSNARIYAAGDICTPYKFTHVADAMARIVIRNALFFGRARMSALTIPWCVYTDPEIAHVGLTPAEAGQRGIRIRTFAQEFTTVDRAVIDDETEGFVKVHVGEHDDGIVGATIVASHAGEMINELTLAMKHGIGLSALADVIHPYPTQVEAIRKLGDAYNRTRLTPRVRRMFQTLLAWRR